MANWDDSQKILFRIDREKIKNEIDLIQNEKIDSLRRELAKSLSSITYGINENKKLIDKINIEANSRIHRTSALTSKAIDKNCLELENLKSEFNKEKIRTHNCFNIGIYLISIAIIQGVLLWITR